MKCSVYEAGFLCDYKFSVILARYRDRWSFCKHKERDTWEHAGGHIEPGETPLDAAKRELFEETGAVDFDIAPLCDYWACAEPHETRDIGWANGAVFLARVRELGALPGSEMEKIGLFDALPENLTYPDITPLLFSRAEEALARDGGAPENPWRKIALRDYDAHMAHPRVGQLRMLSKITREQFALLPAKTRARSRAAILGIAGGNGLKHAQESGIGDFMGIDININYLAECARRFPALRDRLSLHALDLTRQTAEATALLSCCDLIIANLLIEHIGLHSFMKIVAGLPLRGQTVSCVVQVNPDGAAVGRQAEAQDAEALTAAMRECGYALAGQTAYDLPGGKQFLRLDYQSP